MTALERLLQLLAWGMLLAAVGVAQQSSPAPPPAKAAPAEGFSGMYSFLREGEFVQITVEDAGQVTGFVSRYGEKDSDHGAFLNHFFKQGKLDGHDLSFTTQTVHGTWFAFKGKIDRGPATSRAQEGYYVLKGTLTQSDTDAAKKVTSKARDVEFKLFPEDASAADAPGKGD